MPFFILESLYSQILFLSDKLEAFVSDYKNLSLFEE